MVTLGSWVFCSANSVIFVINYLYQSAIIIVIKSMNHNMIENGKWNPFKGWLWETQSPKRRSP